MESDDHSPTFWGIIPHLFHRFHNSENWHKEKHYLIIKHLHNFILFWHADCDIRLCNNKHNIHNKKNKDYEEVSFRSYRCHGYGFS